ncbi:MAG: phosphoglucosamine mutase, partial [bacterium]
TPTLCWLIQSKPVLGGVMNSASHNPFYDNGLKPFRHTGEKLSEEDERQLETIIEQEQFDPVARESIGQATHDSNLVDRYVRKLTQRDVQFDGHVVIDCANGGTSFLAPEVLSNACGELTVINREPNGTNINDECGSLHPEVVEQEVINRNADVGFAFDGDGDRVLAVNSEGDLVNGDILMYGLSRNLQKSPPQSGLVMTVMSNIGLRRALDRENIPFEVVGVGDRNVYRKLKELGWRLGGEQSGHIIDCDWIPTGDGLNTVLRVLDILAKTQSTLRDWQEDVTIFPQVLHNASVTQKPPLEELDQTQKLIGRVENELGKQGRVLVRYSGTESVARVMIEGQDKQTIEQYAKQIGERIVEDIESRSEVAQS